MVVEVQANAFLHHMVRNIVGSLLLVGRGEKPEAWIAELLAGRDRTVAGPTAPSGGLVFLGPLYPQQWGPACGSDLAWCVDRTPIALRLSPSSLFRLPCPTRAHQIPVA